MSKAIEHVKKPGLPLESLEQWHSDIATQPDWRSRSDRAADYYDGKQWSPEARKILEERGQPVITNNLMGPAIDGVLGLEAKTRQEMMVVADDDDSKDVAEALNVKFNEACRIAEVDRACSDAYAAMIKTGLGWVEVSTNPDPFGFGLRCGSVHRREIFWDFTDMSPGLENARWLFRRRFVDTDTLEMAFPKHKDLIHQVANEWPDANLWEEADTLDRSHPMVAAYHTETESELPRDQWWDSARKRAMVYECYYRVWDKRPVLKVNDGRVVVFDESNPIHLALASSKLAQVVIAPFKKMRLAWFIGPHRVADVPSPHPHDHFPYVPIWGYREDSNGAPYGLAERMIPAQDEVNFRRSKLSFLLNKLTVIKDADAIVGMSDSELTDELFRGDSVVTLSEKRKFADAIKVIWGNELDSQQFQVMQDSMRLVQECAGVYNAFLGQESSATSGVAIDSLVEQGTTTLAEINDNYRYGRNKVGQLILAHLVDQIGEDELTVKTNVGKVDPTRAIVLNKRETDEEGHKKITNNVTRAKTRVVLSDVPNTPGYRQQVARSMLEAMANMPPEFQASMLDLVVEMLDIPAEKRDEMLKRIRSMTGRLDPESMTEEERAALERKQQLQQHMEKLQLETLELELQKLAAEVRNIEAQVESAEVDKAQARAEIKVKLAQVQKIVTEVAKLRAELAGVLEDETSTLKKQDKPAKFTA